MRRTALALVLVTACATPRTVDLAAMEPTDPAAWRLGQEGLELLGPSDYDPPHRSPRSIALFPDVVLGDFDLEVEAKQTGRAYGHRDLCLFFGYQSPSRYYYVHLAPAPDPNAHNVFLVNDAPRRPLAPVAEEGVEWGTDTWHTLRVERRLGTGSIRVFFDDLAHPVLEAVDRTLGAGSIGVGSFDDSGVFRRLVVTER